MDDPDDLLTRAVAMVPADAGVTGSVRPAPLRPGAPVAIPDRPHLVATGTILERNRTQSPE